MIFEPQIEMGVSYFFKKKRRRERRSMLEHYFKTGDSTFTFRK